MRSYCLPLAVLLCVTATGAMWAGETAPAKVKHVILVSIDGLAASYFDDPKAEMPTLRMLAKQGARAEGMLTSFPSVTWPSHTSLVTGVKPAKHGVIGNSVWDRKKNRSLTYIGDPELTKDQAIRVPTLYDAASAAGLKSASVIWPCCNDASSLAWVIPDSNKAELHARYTTPGLAADLAKAGIDISPLGKWGWDKQYSTPRDKLYTQVAIHLLEKQQVNLVLLHLITPDGVEHAYGPHTREAYQAVAESDAHVRALWDAIQKPPFAGASAMFVVSDHGFAPYEKFIRPNVVLKELGLVTADADGKVTGRRAWCVPQGGSAFVYVLVENRQKEILSQLKDKLAALEGVEAVVEPAGFARLGIPGPDENPEAPHLVLLTGPGYSFADVLTEPSVADAGGLKGTHGNDPAPAYMHATFVAAGAGINPGVKLKTIHNTDVAPTIARLLGLEMKDVDGRVLAEILAP